jgi:predicted nucleic acid-binding protein
MRIYIDTSVINGLYAQDEKIKKDTINFFQKIKIFNYTIYISEATIEELENTPQESKRKKLKSIVKEHQMEILPTTAEVRKLANEYIKKKLIPKKYFPDAFQISIASIYNIPILISWNFEHIVRVKTKLGVNIINREKGYPQITICSPKEV